MTTRIPAAEPSSAPPVDLAGGPAVLVTTPEKPYSGGVPRCDACGGPIRASTEGRGRAGALRRKTCSAPCARRRDALRKAKAAAPGRAAALLARAAALRAAADRLEVEAVRLRAETRVECRGDGPFARARPDVPPRPRGRPPPPPPPGPARRGGRPRRRPPEGQIAAALAGAALERSPGRMFPEEEAEMPRSDWSTLARTRRSGKYMEPAMDGRKLAWARRKSGYSPAELAAAVRTAVPGLRTRAADVLRWEAVRPTRRRRREGPSTTEGAALAELLGRPLRSFFAFRTVRIQASSWR